MLSNVRKGDIVKYYSANIIKHYTTTNVYKHSVNNNKKCIKEINIPQIFPRTNRDIPIFFFILLYFNKSVNGMNGES